MLLFCELSSVSQISTKIVRRNLIIRAITVIVIFCNWKQFINFIGISAFNYGIILNILWFCLPKEVERRIQKLMTVTQKNEGTDWLQNDSLRLIHWIYQLICLQSVHWWHHSMLFLSGKQTAGTTDGIIRSCSCDRTCNSRVFIMSVHDSLSHPHFTTIPSASCTPWPQFK